MSPLEKSYWRSYHCSSLLKLRGDRITGEYCKTRWCMVCNSIRTAQHIERYAPIINQWENSRFVTLTDVNVPADLLRSEIESMLHDFSKINQTIYRRWKRGGEQDPKFCAVRKLECTHNRITDTYNPHFHVIVKDAEHAKFIVDRWLKYRKTADAQAQKDVQTYGDGKFSELFKYMTKVVTGKSGKRQIHPRALDVIFTAMHRKRTVQNYGFKVGKIDDEESGEAELEAVETVFAWMDDLYDWVDIDTGELLTGYVPGERFIKFLEGYK